MMSLERNYVFTVTVYQEGAGGLFRYKLPGYNALSKDGFVDADKAFDAAVTEMETRSIILGPVIPI